jgi:pyruvate dehydrogenase E2 component (dihydrolipoamide acetyltransferase)
MAEVIRLPRMSDTMEEGVIAAWHKKVGDKIKSGDLLAEVETDKATMELESYNDGTLLYIGVNAGRSVPVNGIIAVIGKEGESFETLLTDKPVEVATTAAPETTTAPTAAASPAAASLDITKIEEAILMPRMSDTMTEAVIANWNKKVGDTVKNGELLAEVETDKATMELESYKAGKLLWVATEAGGKIPVNSLLCIIGDDKTDVAAIVAASKNIGSAPADVDNAQATAPAPTQAANPPAEAASTVVSSNGRVMASPLAKKLAEEKGININQVKGSGDGGRIVKRDIDSFVPGQAVTATAAAAPSQSVTTAPVFTGEEGYTDAPNSQMRKTIARRLGESKHTAPHFYLKMTVNMDAAMAAREQMNAVSPVKISFNDLVIKACAMALRKHPAVNSSWMGDFIRTYTHIHVGMAVAVPDGLIVPVIRFADNKPLSAIAAEAKDLGKKAKEKKLQPNEFTGNTFTISNLGMMDIDEFTAIINPPDSCILAVGKISEQVVKTADGFGVNNIMKLTLSCDHRSVDGALGASFLQTVKQYLENPVTMLV